MNDAVKLTIITTSIVGAMLVIWSGVVIPEFEKLPDDYSFYTSEHNSLQFFKTNSNIF